MLKLRLILLLAVFLVGYYVGHLPGSPDIFGRLGGAYRSVEETANDISAKAKEKDISVAEAALAHLFDAAAGSGDTQD